MRVSGLREGQSFVTRLTRRSGVVVREVFRVKEGVRVRFDDGEERVIHPHVEVEEMGDPVVGSGAGG